MSGPTMAFAWPNLIDLTSSPSINPAPEKDPFCKEPGATDQPAVAVRWQDGSNIRPSTAFRRTSWTVCTRAAMDLLDRDLRRRSRSHEPREVFHVFDSPGSTTTLSFPSSG